MKVILKVQTHQSSSEIILENNMEATLGRSQKSDYKIPDDQMSSVHLKLSLCPPTLTVEDMGSKNGTYLNGIRIEESEVFFGDEIKVGISKITVNPEKMDLNSIQALTFPGPSKDRAAHELNLDFTGARQINQGGNLPVSKKKQHGPNHKKEVDLRKFAKSKIKLSKQEIKLRNKSHSTFSTTVDTVFMLISVITPLVILNLVSLKSPSLIGQQKNAIFITIEMMTILLTWYWNFKVRKFSFGEKLAGIEKLYRDQK